MSKAAAANPLVALKTSFDDQVLQLQQIQKDFNNFVEARQQLESQLKENDLVLEEMKLLREDSGVFKLVGPVLLKQDKAEAQHHVEKRLDFIRGEINRVEKQIKDQQEKEDKKRIEVLAIQGKLQELQQQQMAKQQEQVASA